MNTREQSEPVVTPSNEREAVCDHLRRAAASLADRGHKAESELLAEATEEIGAGKHLPPLCDTHGTPFISPGICPFCAEGVEPVVTPSATVDDLKARLARCTFADARLINPDGPEALARIEAQQELLNEAFDFLGGVDDAAELRGKILALLNPKRPDGGGE